MIIIVDELSFRASCVASLLSGHPDTSFSRIAVAPPGELAEGKVDADIAEGKLTIFLYHIGGRSLSDHCVMSALECCIAKAAGRPVAVLADAVDDAEISAAIGLGVSGLLPTDMTADAIVAALRFIKVGGKFFPPITESRRHDPFARPPKAQSPRDAVHRPEWEPKGAIVSIGASRSGAPAKDQLTTAESESSDELEMMIGGKKVSLTSRQLEVMHLLQMGLSNKSIGNELNLTESTVKLHVRHLLRKLDASNRTQIALLASSYDMAGPPEKLSSLR